VVDGDGDLLSADREFPCPSARISVSTYREYELSALSAPCEIVVNGCNPLSPLHVPGRTAGVVVASREKS